MNRIHGKAMAVLDTEQWFGRDASRHRVHIVARKFRDHLRCDVQVNGWKIAVPASFVVPARQLLGNVVPAAA